MGLVQVVKSAFQSRETIEKALTSVPTSPQYGTLLFNNGFREPNWEKYGSTKERAMDVSIVEAVIGWIARTFPEAPIVVKERKGGSAIYEIVPEHSMAELIERPNAFFTGVALLTATIIDWNIDGNSYWLKIRGRRNEVTQLWYIPWWMMDPAGPRDANENNYITHYNYRPYSGATTIEIPRENVVHFRNGIDPNNLRKGRSKLRAILREMFTDEEASRFTAALLQNMGVPGIIVSPKGINDDYSPSPDEAKATKEMIKRNFSGDNRGDPMVMQGPVDVSMFGFNPEQMVLRDLRRIPEERISGVYGVAAIVAGLGAGLDRSTFANYAEAREASYEENIIPSQRFIAADLRMQLLPDFEPDTRRSRVDFDRSEVRILQEDKNAESNRLINQFRGGVAMLSEVRGRLGLEVRPEHDVFAVPMAVEYVAATDFADYLALPEPEPTPALGAPGEGDEGNDNADRATDDDAPKGRRRRRGLSGRATKARRGEARLLRVVDRRCEKVRARLLSGLSERYEGIGTVAAEVFEALEPKSLKAIDPASIDAIVSRIMNTPALQNEMQDSLLQFERQYAKSYGDVSQIVFEETSTFLEVELGWAQDDPTVSRIIADGSARVNLLDIASHVEPEIRRAIADAQREGLGPRQIARRIRSEVGGTKHATTIARTEVKRAQNVSSIEAYRKSEVVVGLLAFDNQTGFNDEDCTARDGKVYSFEDAESLTASEHPNGTLSWAPYTGEE